MGSAITIVVLAIYAAVMTLIAIGKVVQKEPSEESSGEQNTKLFRYVTLVNDVQPPAFAAVHREEGEYLWVTVLGHNRQLGLVHKIEAKNTTWAAREDATRKTFSPPKVHGL